MRADGGAPCNNDQAGDKRERQCNTVHTLTKVEERNRLNGSELQGYIHIGWGVTWIGRWGGGTTNATRSLSGRLLEVGFQLGNVAPEAALEQGAPRGLLAEQLNGCVSDVQRSHTPKGVVLFEFA